MPYKSEKIIIAKTEFDRRIKLTDRQKAEIVYKYFTYKDKVKRGILAKTISQRSLAKEYGVSRRLIVWILFPERLKHNIELRIERGGSSQYYNTEYNRDNMKKYRRYKQLLYKTGLIGQKLEAK